jgi:beta-galactosidase
MLLLNYRQVRYLLFFFFVAGLQTVFAQLPERSRPFDNDWRFAKGDYKDAEQVAFDDNAWRLLNLPHDWSIEGPYDRNNPVGRGGGYLPSGVGWYRKTFSLEEKDAKKNIFIGFDGIMANSDVWINGYHLGKRPNGYVSLQYELTGHLVFGHNKKNVLAVRADNTVQPASRWYTGGGVYRHVRLVATNPVHVADRGTYITTSSITGDNADVQVQVKLVNQSPAAAKIVLETTIIDPDGRKTGSPGAAEKINGGGEALIKRQVKLSGPALWSIDNPRLYTAVTKVWIGKKLVDEVITAFGVREAKFDAATGFWLNGKNIKLKGVCLHHDGGAVGAAVPLGVWERRLALLKEVGVNAIRTSHNAVAPEFLDLCDKLGFLVMDETFDTWNARKSHAESGYNLYFSEWWEKDTHDIVMRDRNHPSIIIYSVGNEIHDNLNDSSGFRKYLAQQRLIHSLDNTRPVTMALFRPALSHVYENGLADSMDVVGQNYRENELVAAHENKPHRKVIGTENGHTQQAWLALRDKPYMAGQFLWTGFDYLGEADWPKVVNGQGLFDRTGGARNISFQRQSWWSDKPMVYMMRKSQNAGAGDWISDWSPTDMDTYDDARLQVFSNCDEVELFLNGKSLGVKPRPADNASPRTWNTTFEKGTLKAVTRNAGRVVAEQELRTAGKPAKIVLSADRKTVGYNWDEVVYIRATITDANGTPCLAADNKIRFSSEGAGQIAAVDNGDLADTESFSGSERWAFNGTCIAIVKANAATGKITVRATADNLERGTVTLSVQ